MSTTKKIDWADLSIKSSVLSTCIAILAVSVASPLYLGNKIDSKTDRITADLTSFKSEMYSEMKDFHARLCVIEERNRGK